MSLQPRYSCLQCPLSCQCAAFVASDIDPRMQATIPHLIPATSSETCVVCMHPWICHEAAPFQDTAHINFHYRHGSCPTTQCGGFYSDQPRWPFLIACICLAQWMSHDPIVDPAPTSICRLCPGDLIDLLIEPVPPRHRRYATSCRVEAASSTAWRGLLHIVG
ncbi:hypothetical protein B0H10DRAFT_1942577 [Mycena sp. CBHHK59/15]|nr:hypothetical protein B0H10DRAFT_1942577 [Mycena sp. CBHHK59/15]